LGIQHILKFQQTINQKDSHINGGSWTRGGGTVVVKEGHGPFNFVIIFFILLVYLLWKMLTCTL